MEESIAKRLKEKKLTIAVAESLTGGLVSSRLTSVPGSSDYFDSGLVAYSNRAKIAQLGVPRETIEAHGAVSAETAAQMALGVMGVSGTDIGLASTGIAGPTGGSKEKPVGTVYLALAHKDGAEVELFNFHGTREEISILSAQMLLKILLTYLEQ